MDGMLFPLVLTSHILVGLTVIGLVLLQHGKGADMGAAFGSGASGSLFGASGSANFLSRTTAVLAAVFFLTSLSLSYMASSRPTAKASSSVMDKAKTELPAVAPTAPANPVPEPLGADSKAKEIPK
jgi:preprotein translocase subunit SecG